MKRRSFLTMLGFGVPGAAVAAGLTKVVPAAVPAPIAQPVVSPKRFTPAYETDTMCTYVGSSSFAGLHGEIEFNDEQENQ